MTNPPYNAVSDELIIAHMSTIQGIITRFATNSANCKALTLAVIAALAAVYANTKDPQTLYVAYPVLILLAWLDAFYLSMERTAVNLSRASAAKIQSGNFAYPDLYKISIGGRGWPAIKKAFGAMTSHSIYPFYGVLLLCLVMICVFEVYVFLRDGIQIG